MEQELILYNSVDGKSQVSLMARDGSVWLNQSQLAELFATSKQNISAHIGNILKERELDDNSVVNYYLTTAAGPQTLSTDRVQTNGYGEISRHDDGRLALVQSKEFRNGVLIFR